MIGETGGPPKKRQAYIQKSFKKPWSGLSPAKLPLPGAVWARGRDHRWWKGTAAEKMAALTAAGVKVVKSPADIGTAVKSLL